MAFLKTKPLVAICGLAGSGKSTAANHLVREHRYFEHPFAGPLKAAAAVLTGLPVERDPADPEARERVDQFWGFSPRDFLQRFGQGMRGLYGEDFWLRAWDRTRPPGHKVVVTDCRYPNEVDFLQDQGAVIIGIERPGLSIPEATLAHSSEQMALHRLHEVCDKVVVNDGSIARLQFLIERSVYDSA